MTIINAQLHKGYTKAPSHIRALVDSTVDLAMGHIKDESDAHNGADPAESLAAAVFAYIFESYDWGQQVEIMACIYVGLLEEHLEAHEMDAVRNGANEHDFMDANDAIMLTWDRVPMPPLFGWDGSGISEANCNLINEIVELARANGMTQW